jgi:replicative DNA helicase
MIKTNHEDPHKIITQVDATTKSWLRFNENRTKDWGLQGHDCGIHPLNMAIGGWIPTRLTTIGARSGIGKTATIAEFAKGASRVLNGRRAEICFFTWEMNPDIVVDRSVSNNLGITSRMLGQGSKLMDDEQLQLVRSAYKEASKLPIQYQSISTDINTVISVFSKFVDDCKRKEDEEGVKIVPVAVIDYLGMARFEAQGLRTYAISEFVNGLKHAANRFEAAMVLYFQLKRDSDSKDVPERSDAADSAFIENASDNMVFLHRPEYNNINTIVNPETGDTMDSIGKMLVRVLKSRDYGTGDFIMNCDIKYNRFWDLSHLYDYKYWEMYKEEQFWRRQFGI